jgi:diguanylate cyclase (GGDEF)-like protein
MDPAASIRGADPAFRRYAWAVAAVWTVVVAASGIWNVLEKRQETLALARIQASIGFDKDVLYRLWGSLHGGVYAPVTGQTQPNPYLQDVPERDITTPSGRQLTLLNPAYMTRQVHELEETVSSVRGHITSLKPIRPENAPDPWEAEALEAFQAGASEATTRTYVRGREYFRLMRPLATEAACLACHAEQGYQQGDIRGGISVSVPMMPLRALERKHIMEIGAAHAALWILGLAGVGFGARRLGRSELERRRLEEELRAQSWTDELTGLYNRRGFIALAAQHLKVADRMRDGLFLLFLDLDDLKGINDRFGHAVGDRALQETAKTLRDTFRRSDIIARLGGDEFVVFGIETKGVEVELLTSRLKANLASCEAGPDRPYQLTMSMGLARLEPEGTDSIESLLDRADRLMYGQKLHTASPTP